MKSFEEPITITVVWRFSSDGQTLRSTVIGGYQGEIRKSMLRVYGPGGLYSECYKMC